MSSGRAILVLNAGSSSLKFALFEIGAGLKAMVRALFHKIILPTAVRAE